MAQAARRLAWLGSEVQQAVKQARVWADGLVVLHERIGGRFGRVEPRRRALAYLQDHATDFNNLARCLNAANTDQERTACADTFLDQMKPAS
jgi:hypothetical protein